MERLVHNKLGNVIVFGAFDMQRGANLATCSLSSCQQRPSVRLGTLTMAEKLAHKTNESVKNGQQEELQEKLISSADRLRQAMGNWANKL
jgi:hypothetical protein